MAEPKSSTLLVWGVLALAVAAGLAAYVLSPSGPSPPSGTNQPPEARISPTDVVILQGEEVNFSAASSTDPDGNVRSFAWDFGDGTTGTGAIVTHKYEITGAHRVKLEVTDDKGAKNSTTTMVWVNLLEQAVGLATWAKSPLPPGSPSTVAFPVDPNATRVRVSLILNTTNLLGAKAVVSILDPGGAQVYMSDNISLSPGAPLPLPMIELNASALALEGQWTLKVEARPADATAQPSVQVGYTGSLRVEYNPV